MSDTDWLDAQAVRELMTRTHPVALNGVAARAAYEIVRVVAALPERKVVEAGTAHRIWQACRADVGEPS